MIDVDLEALRRHARSVGDLGDDLGAATGRWREALTTPCDPSVAAVRDAYLQDFAVYAEALRSWAEAARTAVSTYDESDRP